MIPDPTILGQVAELTLQALRPSWSGLFDQIQVWRSSDLAGPFTELTGPQSSAPRLPAGGGDRPASPPSGKLLALVDLKLSFLLDERRQVDVTFTGTGSITVAEAALQLAAGSSGLLQAWVDTTGTLVVESYEAGNAHILRVLPSDAAVLLGFETTGPGSYAYGRDARIALTDGVESYPFTDHHSGDPTFYRTRYMNSASLDVSEFSTAFPSSSSTAVAGDVIVGTIDLVDLAGRPTRNREVVVASTFSGQQVGSLAVSDSSLSALTDVNGHAEFRLVRGSKVTLVIAGTKLARAITVPTDPTITTFSLLDPTVGIDDLFTVQQPSIDWAVRRSF